MRARILLHLGVAVLVLGSVVPLVDEKQRTAEAGPGVMAAASAVADDICVEGRPVDQPLIGGIQRMLQATASFCFPASGGDVRGTIVYVFYTEDSERSGTGPVRITCSYNFRYELTFHGRFTPPATIEGGAVDLAIRRDILTMQGPDCATQRRVPSTSTSGMATWNGTFDGQRLTVSVAGQLMFEGRVSLTERAEASPPGGTSALVPADILEPAMGVSLDELREWIGARTSEGARNSAVEVANAIRVAFGEAAKSTTASDDIVSQIDAMLWLAMYWASLRGFDGSHLFPSLNASQEIVGAMAFNALTGEGDFTAMLRFVGSLIREDMAIHV